MVRFKVGDRVMLVDKYVPFHPQEFAKAVHTITGTVETSSPEYMWYPDGSTWVDGNKDQSWVKDAWVFAEGPW